MYVYCYPQVSLHTINSECLGHPFRKPGIQDTGVFLVCLFLFFFLWLLVRKQYPIWFSFIFIFHMECMKNMGRG